MSFSEFLKDKLPAIGLGGAGLSMMLIFMLAFKANTQQIFAVCFIYVLIGMVILVWDFFRRRRFYVRLMEDLDRLDRKYLISEMVEPPDFIEGRLLCEVLAQTGSAMCGQVAAYRREAADFREYIELWVHEIKLPLAGMQLMTHNSPDGKKYSAELKRLEEYIDNVLYYTRCDNAEKDYLIKPVSLKRAFSNTALKNRELLQHNGVSLCAEGLDTTVMTDSKWLEYMLGQLMGNSLKYLRPEVTGEITVFTAETAAATELHFRDNGCGIPAADLPRIFDKSFTGENGRTHAASTGMGLYIIKSLCTRLGHTVRAESVQGEYTDIIISFGKNEMKDIVSQEEK